jgi:hypothetical protein
LNLDCVAAALASLKPGHVRDEAALQAAIHAALAGAGIHAKREVVLAPRCRVDLLTDRGIGIEVKRGKPNRQAVAAQLQRYAETGKLIGIVLVMDRMILPVEAGIPYRFVSLNMNWGVAT